jgi:hypothetical protein
MHRAFILAATSWLMATAGIAQTSSPDSQVMQALLTEIHALRQDLQTAVTAIQRVQILTFRVQTQTAILNRANSRLDDAHTRCIQVQDEKRQLAAMLDQNEAELRTVQNPADQKRVEEMIARLRPASVKIAGDEQQCQVREAEADRQARAEQAKMNDLQDQLDKLDKVLAGLGGK